MRCGDIGDCDGGSPNDLHDELTRIDDANRVRTVAPKGNRDTVSRIQQHHRGLRAPVLRERDRLVDKIDFRSKWRLATER